MAEGPRMGVPWVDLTKACQGAMKVLEWDPGAPNWRQAQPGLCIEGVCTTRSCNAYNKSVIHNWGINKEFNLFDNLSCVKCPLCGIRVDPQTCAFNRCDWKFRGKQWHGFAVGRTEIIGKPSRAGNAYNVFDGSVTARWTELTIVTTEMGRLVGPNGTG